MTRILVGHILIVGYSIRHSHCETLYLKAVHKADIHELFLYLFNSWSCPGENWDEKRGLKKGLPSACPGSPGSSHQGSLPFQPHSARLGWQIVWCTRQARPGCDCPLPQQASEPELGVSLAVLLSDPGPYVSLVRKSKTSLNWTWLHHTRQVSLCKLGEAKHLLPCSLWDKGCWVSAAAAECITLHLRLRWPQKTYCSSLLQLFLKALANSFLSLITIVSFLGGRGGIWRGMPSWRECLVSSF